MQIFVSLKVYQWFGIVKRWICFKLEVDQLRTLHKQLSEIRVFSLFLKDKMHKFERMRFEMILEHFTTDLMNWKVKIWKTGDSQISDKVEFYFNSPDKHVLFRRFAFENSNFLMQNSIFFQKIRNFWFWNFYFKWVDIIEKMLNFDGWPGVE